MDILKILSRGTSRQIRPAPGTQTAAAATNLPSAGSRANPQLFHDDVVTSKKLKRKRKRDQEDLQRGADAVEEDEVSDVDFFAPPKEARPKQVQDAEHQAAAEAEQAQKRKRERKTKLLSEEECRQLLKSHRLKLTLLSSADDKTSKVKKSSRKGGGDNKKKEKKAVVAAVETKEEMRQLYPQLLTSFAQLRSTYEISHRLAENIENESYKLPTEVQMASLPLLLDPKVAFSKSSSEAQQLGAQHDDVHFMAVAPTGSGKTLSFLVPAMNDVLRRRAESGAKDKGHHELEVVILAPTRELALQIANEGRKLAVGTGVRIVAMKKGMRVSAQGSDGGGDAAQQEDEVSDEGGEEEEESDEEDGGKARNTTTAAPVTKADVLVTTPMLLLNFLRGKGPEPGGKRLPSVRSLVLDEADVLLDPLFREQTTGIWSACVNPDLRLTFWSATMGSNIETLVLDQLVSQSGRREAEPKPLVRLVVGLKDTAVPNITHKLTYTATEPGKLLALRQLLHPTSGTDSGPPLRPPFLVFTQTIERATALHSELKYDIPLAAGGSVRIAVLHSSLSDSVRAGIMRRFRSGEIWVLITTDVLARGVDFAGVNGVVNYDVPGSPAAYIHRAGRTGRAGREGGVAVTFYTKEDIPFVRSVANVIALSEKQAGKKSGGDDGTAVQQWLLDALPKVAKADKKKLKERGVEVRRTGGKAKITSKSAWERRKEHNKRGAIEGSKRRRLQAEDQSDGDDCDDDAWEGIGA